MNNEQMNKLIATARRDKPDTSRSEYGFETRLMARIRERKAQPWFVWTWRLAPVFAAIVLALGVWNLSEPTDLRTALGGTHAETQLVNYLTGE